jgi:hypothetical protein
MGYPWRQHQDSPWLRKWLTDLLMWGALRKNWMYDRTAIGRREAFPCFCPMPLAHDSGVTCMQLQPLPHHHRSARWTSSSMTITSSKVFYVSSRTSHRSVRSCPSHPRLFLLFHLFLFFDQSLSHGKGYPPLWPRPVSVTTLTCQTCHAGLTSSTGDLSQADWTGSHRTPLIDTPYLLHDSSFLQF